MSAILSLFEGFGVELEYMLVHRETLAVMPICDAVMFDLAGEYANEVSLGRVNVSNELVLHVIEFKGNGPQRDLQRLQQSLQNSIVQMNARLAPMNAMLLPTAMHPLMNPKSDTRLWPHGQKKIYETYNRIFDCRGHGWSNLQSIHINFPFASDEEFGRLHAAIRIALPLLPALAASSPIVEGKLTGMQDSRLDFYSQNQKRIPSIIGQIIPEAVFSRESYENLIIAKIEADIKPLDKDGVLEGEWLNSRGAIARFDRNAIEIRVLDIQESLAADFAVISLVIGLVKSLVDEAWIDFKQQMTADEKSLRSVFMETVRFGREAQVSEDFLCQCFQIPAGTTSQILWSKIAHRLLEERYIAQEFESSVQNLLRLGSLSSRIVSVLGENPQPDTIVKVWKELAACLSEGKFYVV